MNQQIECDTVWIQMQIEIFMIVDFELILNDDDRWFLTVILAIEREAGTSSNGNNSYFKGAYSHTECIYSTGRYCHSKISKVVMWWGVCGSYSIVIIREHVTNVCHYCSITGT